VGGRSEQFWARRPGGRPLPEFEWDPAKSATNKTKHGVDFEQATAMWLDERAVKILAGEASEVRYYLIAKLNGKMYTAIWTTRGTVVRLISVRRSRRDEVTLYSGQD